MSSYKGYKDYRAYLNAKLHALSINICGNRQILDNEIEKILLMRPGINDLPKEWSTTMLTTEEAETIYRRLYRTLSNIKSKSTADPNLMTLQQRKAIIKLTKYNFSWSVPATFSFILGILPEKRKRLNGWEIRKSKITRLFSLLSKKDADKIIKRLDMIKKRNLQNNYSAEMAHAARVS